MSAAEVAAKYVGTAMVLEVGQVKTSWVLEMLDGQPVWRSATRPNLVVEHATMWRFTGESYSLISFFRPKEAVDALGN